MKDSLTQHIDYEVHEVADTINWFYFFHAWGYAARFVSVSNVHNCPACRQQWLSSFSDAERPQAESALSLFNDAQQLLQQLDGHYRVHTAFTLLNANGEGDDIVIQHNGQQTILPCLRQQTLSEGSDCYLCLSDFLKPAALGADTLGVFAAAVDASLEQDADRVGATQQDDYTRLLMKTLGERLTEAAVEKMHQTVRTQVWAYAKDEHLSKDDLLFERFQGIRPAVGYPSLPDQSINFILNRLLPFHTVGIQLTENGAMYPHAAVSGLMMAHPKSRYFAVGRIGDDQLRQYASRRGLPLEKMKRFLARNVQM